MIFVIFCASCVPLLDYTKQVRHLRDGPAHRVGIGALDNLVELSQSQTAHDRFMRFWRGDEASIVLNANRRL